MSHQTTAWLQRRLGRAAVPSLAGITMLPQRSVRGSYLGAAGRISTTISPRMSAPTPAIAQVFVLCYYSTILFIFFVACVYVYTLLIEGFVTNISQQSDLKY